MEACLSLLLPQQRTINTSGHFTCCWSAQICSAARISGLHSSAASFSGGLRTTGLLSFKFTFFVPPGVLRFYHWTFLHLHRDHLSPSSPQSVACSLLLCNRRPNRISHCGPCQRLTHVIISGQLLTLLLRGDFSPQYFPAIWDAPLTGDPP